MTSYYPSMPTKPNRPRPEGWAEEYARTFTDKSVAMAYHTRPEYPAEAFGYLRSLAHEKAGRALDLGCGTGFIARGLSFAAHVDAVDFSENMVVVARALPATTKVRWIVGKAEEAPLSGPYDLATAGESLHWMDWDLLFPHVGTHLAAKAPFVILTNQFAPNPWDDEFRSVIRRYSTNRKYSVVDLVDEIESRGLFRKHDEKFTDFTSYLQDASDYVQSFHARNGLSSERLTRQAAEEFDRELLEILKKHLTAGQVSLKFRCQLVSGAVL